MPPAITRRRRPDADSIRGVRSCPAASLTRNSAANGARAANAAQRTASSRYQNATATPIRAARRQVRTQQRRRLFLSDPPRSDNLKADAQTGIANNGNRQPQEAGRPVGAARMTRAKRTKTIAQHMRDILTEYGCGGVMWGDVCLLDDCAERCTHTGLLDMHR